MNKVEMSEKREIQAKLPAKRHKHDTHTHTKNNNIHKNQRRKITSQTKKHTKLQQKPTPIIYYSCNNEW